MAIGCGANWLRNRTLHCAITGPLFLIAALVFLMSDVTETHVNSLLVWPLVVIGVGIAFLLEWRYTRLSALYLCSIEQARHPGIAAARGACPAPVPDFLGWSSCSLCHV